VSRKAKTLMIDLLALELRKPCAGPLVTPSEAVAIALSMLPAKSTGHICSPDSVAVRLILQALKRAGWKIEPS
jgi:hypothetical protein